MKQWFATPSPSVRLADAETIQLGKREWVAVHTPGHTPDHLCLFDPAGGVLLSGDHVLPTITPAHLRHRRRPRPAQRVLRVAREGRPSSTASPSCCPRTAIPSTTCAAGSRTSSATTKSGSPDSGKRPTSSGEATVEQLSQRLFRERSWGPMAESETYAHLEHLRLSGQATRQERDGTLLYSLA